MNKLSIKDCINTHCPWSGEPVTKDGLTLLNGQVVGFCNAGCRIKFEKAIALFERSGAERPAKG